jgi:hypothetical protein
MKRKRASHASICAAIVLCSSQLVFAQAEQADVAQVAAPQVAGSVSKVVVAQFTAPKESHARAAVLQTIADHDDVEVVALDDLAFAAKHVGANPATPEGRVKLSAELGIRGWIDGRVTDDETAVLTLTGADGKRMAEVEVDAPNAKLLDALSGEKMWAAMGTHLSAREGQRRQLLAIKERARAKVEARAAEAERQKVVARQAAQYAAQQRAMGIAPAPAQSPFAQPQSPFAQAQGPLASPYAHDAGTKKARGASRSARGKTASNLPEPALTNTAGWSQSGTRSVPGWNTPAGRQPVGPTGVSAATQRWLAQQREVVGMQTNTGARMSAPQ